MPAPTEIPRVTVGAGASAPRRVTVDLGARTDRGLVRETNEDALVMWAHEIDTPDYSALLAALERAIPGETRFEERRW